MRTRMATTTSRTPVIIITWLGMVSMTGIDVARGWCRPAPRSASRFGISPLSISSGRQPSTTSTYARFRVRDPAAAAPSRPTAVLSTTVMTAPRLT